MQAEADRLIFEDPDAEVGFVLHPDMKWVCAHRCQPVFAITHQLCSNKGRNADHAVNLGSNKRFT